MVLPQPDGPTMETISPALNVERTSVESEQIAGTCVVNLGGVNDAEFGA